MSLKRIDFLDKIIDKGKYDIFLITTYILGVVLSAAAQIFAISRNDKYKKQEKTFLSIQEGSDAFINCGLYALVTLPVRDIVSKLIESGKYITKDCRDFIEKYAPHKLADLGKFDTNIDTLLENMLNKKNNTEIAMVRGGIDRLRSSMATHAVVGGGLFASCILAPIVRNISASYITPIYRNISSSNRNENTTTINPQVNSTPVTKPNPQTNPNPETKPRVETKPSTFDDFRTRATGMKI